MSRSELLGELGFYTLAGFSASPGDVVTESQRADELGIGSAFVSERFNLKDAAVLSGAVAAASSRIGVATAATNPNTRHPIVTATMATTTHRLSGGRFALGLGRGFAPLWDVLGLEHVTMAQLEDLAGILRTLWRGEAVVGHDGPAGRFPFMMQDPSFDEDIPLLLVALGERTLEFAGRVFDSVVLHTFFTDETLERSVAAVRRGATSAGRDPDSVRVWSVLATVHDGIDDEMRLRKMAGRFATYLQGYGDLLISVNGWDPDVLASIRSSDAFTSARGAIDQTATIEELMAVDAVLPEEWLAASATGSPAQCAQRILDQFDAGADGVILHGATPDELVPVLDAYRLVRPPGKVDAPANPGRAQG